MSNPTTDVAAPKSPPGKGGKPQPPPPIVPDTTSEELLALAKKHELKPLNVRPPLFTYVREVVQRWTFIRVLASSTAYARNQNNYLGQVWAVLTPVLNAAVYVLIFGMLLGISRGLANSVAYIVVGVFIFRFIESSVTGGGKSIAGKVNLIRSLHFPRAVLPISTVLSNLHSLVPTLVVMGAIVLLSGYVPTTADVPYQHVHLTWWWLLLPAAVALVWIFNTGLAFIMARVQVSTPDIENVIAFVMRFVMYGSGVIFPVSRYVDKLPLTPGAQDVTAVILDYQPVAVFLYLFRSILLQEETIPPDGFMWLLGGIWAVLFFVVGLIFFWFNEERYGRD